MCVYSSIPFGLEGGMWDLIVLISDHCHGKEGPLYFLPLVKEALGNLLCPFLQLEKIIFACFFFILFQVSDIRITFI